MNNETLPPEDEIPAAVALQGGDSFVGSIVVASLWLGFGGFFLAVTAFRLNRIAAALAFLEHSRPAPPEEAPSADSQQHGNDLSNHSAHSHHSQGNTTVLLSFWARTFVRQHIPEDDTVVIRRTSLALMGSALLGLVWGSLGDTDASDDATPFYTSVVISLLFLVAGGTGWCEAGGLLPRDSLRVGLVGAFGGKALLWQAAAAATVDPSLAWNHQIMARLATATAVTLSLSVLLSNRDYGRQNRRQDDGLVEEATPLDATGEYPCCLFFLHVASWVFVSWQGLWVVVNRQVHHPERLACYFILQGLGLALLVQGYLVLLMRRYQPRRYYNRLQASTQTTRCERSPERVPLELGGA